MQLLSSQPRFGIEFRVALTQLELENVVASHRSEHLTGGDMLSARHVDARKVAIDRDVATMSHHDDTRAAECEDCRHLAVEDGACLTPRVALDVDALVVERLAQVCRRRAAR